MAKLKAIGSEKLDGADKLKRIMEIATYRMPSMSITESATEYSINLADGMKYHIVKEKQGYIIKKGLNESTLDYMEPMKNRIYFSSYSQALRKLNLVIKETSELYGETEEVKLFGEQKKFVLKTPTPPAPELEAPAVPAEPAPLPEPELPMADMGTDVDMDMGVEVPSEEPMDMEQDAEEKVSFRVIQKLTGKLTQKMRALESQEGMTSEDIKYVINMVLSSFDLNSLSEEDTEDILSKFEEDTEDLGGDDMDGEDMTDDSEVEDIQADMDLPIEGEMEEDYGNVAIFDGIFGESKVDKVISKYFEHTKKEIRESQEKQVEKTLRKKTQVKQIMESVVKMTETVEQELSAEKFLKENTGCNFVGKTNKKNLVFETKKGQIKITPTGEII
jgi:hypothetical protein